jgi:uncharacterized membrane protein
MGFYSNSVNMLFGAVMLVVVVVLGFAVAFTDFYSDRLFGWRRIVFIVMMFAYAAYRGIRIYQEIKKRQSTD